MKRCMLAGVSVFSALLLSQPATLLSQAIERSMYVTAVDQTGAPVPNLGPSDFIVREDNVSREVLRVVPATDPMQIAILVDNSSAAASQLPHIRRALPAFVDTLTKPTASGRRNEVAIIALGGRPTVLADYSIDPAPVTKAIDRLWEENNSGQYLLDGIIEVSQGFKKRESARPVIVAITSEGAELSNRRPDQVLDPLRESGAALHVISLGFPTTGISDDVRDRNRVVDEGPRVSGGAHEQMLVASALPVKLQQLARVLTNAYRVVYAHPDSLIPPERVTITARRTDLTALGTLVKDQQARR
jgi:VWA domain-containing protein